MASTQRIHCLRGVPQPVLVAAPDRGEPGIKTVRGTADLAYHQVIGQGPGEPSGQQPTGVLRPAATGERDLRQVSITGVSLRSTRANQVSNSPWTVRRPG